MPDSPIAMRRALRLAGELDWPRLIGIERRARHAVQGASMHSHSRRRLLQGGLAVAGLSLLCGSGPKTPRIGFLAVGSREGRAFLIEGFLQGLREHGYVEGESIVIEYRFSGDRNDRLPELAAELVALKVDLIVASGSPASFAAKQVTDTIPIVMGSLNADPVATGLIASLAHPGGNITGITEMAPQLSGKRLQLLKDTMPNLLRVAVFWNPLNPAYDPILKDLEAAAQTMGVELQRLEVRVPEDFEGAFEAATRWCADHAGRPPGHQPAKNGRGSRAQVPATYDGGKQGDGSGRGPAVPGAGHCRFIPTLRNPRGQDPEGDQAGEPADGAAHEVRLVRQPEDRPGSRDDDSAVSPRAGHSSDRVGTDYVPTAAEAPRVDRAAKEKWRTIGLRRWSGAMSALGRCC
jgi:ABC transporter substrate binding protein